MQASKPHLCCPQECAWKVSTIGEADFRSTGRVYTAFLCASVVSASTSSFHMREHFRSPTYDASQSHPPSPPILLLPNVYKYPLILDTQPSPPPIFSLLFPPPSLPIFPDISPFPSPTSWLWHARYVPQCMVYAGTVYGAVSVLCRYWGVGGRGELSYLPRHPVHVQPTR